MTNWNRTIHAYVQEHLPAFIFVSVLFVMGIFFGAMLVNALTLEQKQNLSYQLNEFFLTLEPREIAAGTFRESIGLHLKWLLLIWGLGLTVVGMPLVLLLDFVKGVLLGFSVGYLVGELSWKGALFAFITVAPQNLLTVPALLIASVAAISFSLFVVRNRFLRQRGSLSRQFSRYGAISLAMCAVLIAVSLFEAFVVPVLIEWASPWLGAV